MNDDPLIERLQRMAEDLPVPISDLGPVRRRARLRKVRSRAIGGLTVTILGLAVLVPLRSLSGLGGDAVVPQDEPWTETYVLSDFEVQYPTLVPDVAPNEPVEGNTPATLDPTMALVTFRSTWSGDVYPGEAQCEIRLFDTDGDAVARESFGFAAFEPPTKDPTKVEVEVDPDKPKPVSADGACGPGVPPGPGTYLISNLHVVAGDNGDDLMADVAWSTKTPPLLQYCIASFNMPDGTRQEKQFEMSLPPETDTKILSLRHGFVDATPLGVRCEPYTGHNGETDGADSTDAPTAQSIMQDGQPVGAELAAALGLELMNGFDHQCQYYVEVENSGAGYCLEGLSTSDTADLYVIAEALRGVILTPEELASFKANNSASGGTQDISSGIRAPKGYASPPDSGYWVLFPDAPQPMGAGSAGAVKIVALTNLPDGTLFLTNTDRGGMCCSAVTDGRMIIDASSSACDKVSGAHGPGLSITITASADIGQHVVGVPLGGQQPQQPDSVLAILGARFENLTGKQVTNIGGEPALVASTRYAWSKPLCLG
jgi:hypothetical protein